jgi:hypothetical protein
MVLPKSGKVKHMVHIELSADEAVMLREVLEGKLRDLSAEINRTDHIDFKEMLRKTERALERLVAQLPVRS